MADSIDNPFGRTGQKLGLRVPDPEVEAGETVRWRGRANRFQGKVRAVGGGLFLTDRRLIFVPNKIESTLFFAKTWSAHLGDLDRAVVGGGPLRTVSVMGRDGGAMRFVVGSREDTAAKIDAAIQAARQRLEDAPAQS